MENENTRANPGASARIETTNKKGNQNKQHFFLTVDILSQLKSNKRDSALRIRIEQKSSKQNRFLLDLVVLRYYNIGVSRAEKSFGEKPFYSVGAVVVMNNPVGKKCFAQINIVVADLAAEGYDTDRTMGIYPGSSWTIVDTEDTLGVNLNIKPIR